MTEEHGDYAAAVRHWKSGEQLCDPCTGAARRVRKRNRLRALAGEPASVPSLGSLRRVRALLAIGWTHRQIAAEANVKYTLLRDLHSRSRVYRASAVAIAEAYERMCATPAPAGRSATCAMALAAYRGWAPPGAWFDIDDPNEQPDFGDDTRMSPAEKLAEFEWLTSLGVAEPEALRQVGWTQEAMEKHLQRQKKEAA